MATSLVHIGDFHAAPGPRNEARYRALDQLLEQATRLPNLGAWLWPGDLSHQRQAIADELALIDRLRAMANRAPVVIVRGNHDVEGDLEKFEAIGAVHPIHVVSRPRVVRLDLATGQTAAIACLPYPHRAGLVAAGVAVPDTIDAAADALDAIFMQFAAELEEARSQGCLTLFIGHVNVGGAVTSVGQPNIGREIELSPRHLDRLGPIYKGLNHIHKAQEIHGAHYAGSICRLDWGEIEEKRWLEIHYDQVCTDPCDSENYVVASHPIDVAPMYHVEGQLTRDGFTYEVKAGPGGEKQPAPPSWQGCEVRVRYTFAQSEAGVLDKSLALAPFAEAARVHPDPIAVPDRSLRAPEVAAAKTLADKLAAWCALTGTVASESVLQKLSELEHHSPADVAGAAGHLADAIASGEVDEQKATEAAA